MTTVNVTKREVTAELNTSTRTITVTVQSNTSGEGGGGVTSHSLLTGLDNDDHTQYLDTTRGDNRYYVKATLDSYLDTKVDKVSGKGLSAEDFTSTEKSKLSGIQVGATANATDAQLRDRETHTGFQATSTITGLDSALAAKVDKVSGKGLSSEDYTTSEKTKLTGIAEGATVNASDAALRDRSTHTGTQLSVTISDFSASVATQLSTWTGSSSLVTLGTVSSGVWNGAAITDFYISSASAWNAKQAALVSGTNIQSINGSSILTSGNLALEPAVATGTTGQYWRGDKTWQTLNQAAVGISSSDSLTQGSSNLFLTPAERTKLANTSGINSGDQDLSTYLTASAAALIYLPLVGGASVTTLGIISTGVWNGTAIGDVYISSAANWNAKQDALVSGTSIKTLNGVSLLGGGNITLSGSTNLSYTPSATDGTVTSDTGTSATLTAADTVNAGLMLPAQVVKLNGITSGATANATDAQLRDRSTHTGTQTADTISDFSQAADARISASNKVSSNTAVVSGSTQITNMIRLTQAQYDAATKDQNTLYIIVG